MVTKKDFKAIAEIIKKQAICNNENPKMVKMVRDIGFIYANNLANYFEQQNPFFNRQKFLNACGL